MFRIFWALCLVLCLVGTSFGETASPARISVYVPEVNLFPTTGIASGDELMGFFCSPGGFRLAPVTVGVETSEDDRGRKVLKVRSRSEQIPLFLARGLSGLKPGVVRTVFAGQKFLYPGESVVLPSVEDQPTEFYTLRGYGKAVNRFNKNLIYDYAVKLFSAKNSQTLEYYRSPGDAATAPTKFAVLNIDNHPFRCDPTIHMELPVLLWAGDLDQDQLLDLYMWWPCPGKDAGVYQLFLSSLAKKGEMLGKIPVGMRTYYSDPQ
jgi:hypothetical protein